MSAPAVDPLDLDAIEARANSATPGPWATSSEWSVRTGARDDELVACVQYKDHGRDAAFIAAARTDVPALVAELRALRAERNATARVVAAARAWDAAEAAWRAGTGTGGLGAVLHAADALRDGLRALDGTAPSADPGTPTLADVPTSILRRIEWHLRPNAPGDSPPRTAEDARWSFVALLNHAGMRIYWPEAGPWRDVRLADVRAELDLRALDARDGAT